MNKVSSGETKKPLHCSFCGKSQHEVRKLIAGWTVFICDPIYSPMDPGVQVLDLAIEVCLVVLPCQPIHTRCGISLEGEECHPE
jgi:hypothetical protein